MKYDIEWEAKAVKEFRQIPKDDQVRIGRSLEILRTDLTGDVSKLAVEKHKYRLRVGRYRILFLLDGNRVVIYRIRMRGDAYSQFLW